MSVVAYASKVVSIEHAAGVSVAKGGRAFEYPAMPNKIRQVIRLARE